MILTPRVSVLIPTYNYEHWLPEAIESVLNQTFQNFELIVLDNASTDNTEEVVSKYLHDPRVKFFVNPERGLVSNWNKSLEFASGEYIKMLCADDKLHPSILEKYVKILDENPSVAIVSCQKKLFGDSFGETPVKLPVHGLLSGRDTIIAQTRFDNFLGEPSLPMFRRRDLQVGNFKNFQWIVDWEMYVRLLTRGDCYIIPEILCYARRHSGQVTAKIRKSRIRQLEEYELFKALYNGEYMEFSSNEKKEIAIQLKRKVAACVAEMYKLMPEMANKESRQTLKKLYSIAAKENSLFNFTSMKMVFKSTLLTAKKKIRRHQKRLDAASEGSFSMENL